MDQLRLVLCAFVSHLTLVHLTEAALFQSFLPFSYEMSDDFTTVFNPWRARVPRFAPAELAPVAKFPAVRVYCDESELIVLVDERPGDVTLNRDEIQLGDGCRSNGERPRQLMFTYGYDRCGTRREVKKGFDVFSNVLHFSPRKVLNMRLATSPVHVSCIPNRSKEPNLPYRAFIDKSREFSIQAMDASWTSAAESNVFMRGQIINVQVSAQIRPHEQLFIQSCFVSTFPESRTKPRHVIIMKKGCAAPSSSPNTVIKFLDSDYSEVNFALNSTYLISEMYIHCSVLISDIGITSGSKSCNFDLVNSRWEELSGNVEVCRCCNSKCKGLSVKDFPRDSKAVVSTGPFVIVQRPAPSFPKPALDSMQSDAAAPEEESVIDTWVSNEFQWPSPPSAVIVVKQDPVSSLTLVLPTRNERSDDGALNDFQVPTMEREANPNDAEGQSANSAPDGPPHMELGNEVWHDDNVVERQEWTKDAQPILSSKIQLSKNADGSQTLSYEEEVVAQDEGAFGTLGMVEPECKRRRSWRGLGSVFLDLLRRMNKVE
ncbi:zona pellucida protein C [Festucalex cinctus]